MAKVDTRTLSFKDLQELRQRGVALVRGGMSQATAAREIGVTPTTMCSWMKRYRQRGADGIVDRRRGKKRILLTAKQSERLRRWIIGGHPGQLRLDFALWTVDAVIALAKDRFGVVMSKRTTHRLLHEWGFTPKRSTRRAWQQDSAAVAKWIAEEYPMPLTLRPDTPARPHAAARISPPFAFRSNRHRPYCDLQMRG
jgi:transposase